MTETGAGKTTEEDPLARLEGYVKEGFRELRSMMGGVRDEITDVKSRLGTVESRLEHHTHQLLDLDRDMHNGFNDVKALITGLDGKLTAFIGAQVQILRGKVVRRARPRSGQSRRRRS